MVNPFKVDASSIIFTTESLPPPSIMVADTTEGLAGSVLRIDLLSFRLGIERSNFITYFEVLYL